MNFYTVKIKTNLFGTLFMNDKFVTTTKENEQIAINEQTKSVLKPLHVISYIKSRINLKDDTYRTDKPIADLTVELEWEVADEKIYTILDESYGRKYLRKPYSNEQEINRIKGEIRLLEDELEEVKGDIMTLETRKNDVEHDIEVRQNLIIELSVFQ